MKSTISILLCILQVLIPTLLSLPHPKASADDFLNNASQGQTMGMNLLSRGAILPSLNTDAPTDQAHSTSSTLYLQEIVPGGQGDTSGLQSYMDKPENMM